MANKYNSLTELFTGIANAIRVKKNSTESIVADNFVDEIADLQTGFDYVNDRITAIPDYAFYRCEELNSVSCSKIKSIGKFAFAYCTSLTNITIPDSVISIGEDAFLYCFSLTSITIPDSVTSIGEQTFLNCLSLTSVTIGDSVTEIDDGAFQNCNRLTSVTIPDSVTSIGERAFADCTSLTSVTIPDSVTTIGSNAFARCDNLKTIYISVPEEDFNVTGAPWGAKNAEIIYAAKNPTNNQTGG